MVWFINEWCGNELFFFEYEIYLLKKNLLDFKYENVFIILIKCFWIVYLFIMIDWRNVILCCYWL